MNPRANPNTCYPRGNKFESIEKWSERDLRRRVFVPYDYDGFALDTTSSLQLEAISDEAHIALVWVQEIHRPIFRLFAVIAERSCELELQSPLV